MSIKIKKYKVGRRLGQGVYDKCQSPKFVLSQAKKVKTSTKRPKRPTDYGFSLLDKQRVRFSYGVREKQFRTYIKKALDSAKKGTSPAQALFKMLENRVDNVLYRSGFAETRRAARQLVSHGHMVINGTRIRVPSHMVRIGDKITIREGSKNKPVFANLAKKIKSRQIPSWIKVDPKKLLVEITGEAKDIDPFLNFQAVIEFYSR